MQTWFFRACLAATSALIAVSSLSCGRLSSGLEASFRKPPDSARPWVYWFWMDGNSSREGITADLEAMKQAGIGGVIIMEVDVGIPKGPVKFMSPEWRVLFKHVVAEAARLGIDIEINSSPGWTGSGGPWVKPEQSMQKVVFSETEVTGPMHVETSLAHPPVVAGFYEDLVVLAFPKSDETFRIKGIEEKALYRRGYFSSAPGVDAYIPAYEPTLVPSGAIVPMKNILNLTRKVNAGGRLAWDVPAGHWTVMRFGRTSTGANTRPAPEPGLGLECDKLDAAAFDAHFNAYLGTLMSDVGALTGKTLTSVHIDSWETGSQNWTARFREEFQRRRGYDPLPYLPVMAGRVLDNLESSERFLWDLRQTVSELATENNSGRLRDLLHARGLKLSVEPYDGSPVSDLVYGSPADVPMCEFWSDTFESWFSCAEASSIAHTHGRPVVSAEAFTSGDMERWQLHPGKMKALGDWAFCQGVNRFTIHRYAHQPWLDRWPGMTMGIYGAHFERTQTWWDMVPAYTTYLSRCQYLLQQGLPVADVCYLAPEGAPYAYRPPASATHGNPPDHSGYNFDTCTADVVLSKMRVQAGRLVLPDGMNYRILVLPQTGTMTPSLLRKIGELVKAGATILGAPPCTSPSLTDYPRCDAEIATLVKEIWGGPEAGVALHEHSYGQGRVLWEGTAPHLEDAESRPARMLAKAKWIWHQEEGNPAVAAPVATRYFRRSFVLPENRAIESAYAVMTADNAFSLWINGHRAGTGGDWHRAYVMDIRPLLQPGENVVAMSVDNNADRPNPAGVIGAGEVKFSDGELLELQTDAAWESSTVFHGSWFAGEAEGWTSAVELGSLGMAPWGTPACDRLRPELYTGYRTITQILQDMSVSPDFESEAELSHVHRRIGDADVYFVANRTGQWVGASCAFRSTGAAIEIWNPLNGSLAKPIAREVKAGCTILPLWLEPSGSVFVVFREGDAAGTSTADVIVSASRDGENLLPTAAHSLSEPPTIETPDARTKGLVVWQGGRYELKTAAGKTFGFEIPAPPSVEVGGSWDVNFQPRRGAPDHVTLDSLTDWAKHADPGIQHFAGIASYTKEIAVPAEFVTKNRRVVLDLGSVQVMARVTLNGHDLGVVWKKPFRMDITEAVQAGTNSLQVSVANLWPNRLIGDAGLPEDKRVSWTTWNPFTPDTPLLESGLLGPVRLISAGVVTLP